MAWVTIDFREVRFSVSVDSRARQWVIGQSTVTIDFHEVRFSGGADFGPADGDRQSRVTIDFREVRFSI